MSNYAPMVSDSPPPIDFADTWADDDSDFGGFNEAPSPDCQSPISPVSNVNNFDILSDSPKPDSIKKSEIVPEFSASNTNSRNSLKNVVGNTLIVEKDESTIQPAISTEQSTTNINAAQESVQNVFTDTSSAMNSAHVSVSNIENNESLPEDENTNISCSETFDNLSEQNKDYELSCTEALTNNVADNNIMEEEKETESTSKESVSDRCISSAENTKLDNELPSEAYCMELTSNQSDSEVNNSSPGFSSSSATSTVDSSPDSVKENLSTRLETDSHTLSEVPSFAESVLAENESLCHSHSSKNINYANESEVSTDKCMDSTDIKRDYISEGSNSSIETNEIKDSTNEGKDSTNESKNSTNESKNSTNKCMDFLNESKDSTNDSKDSTNESDFEEFTSFSRNVSVTDDLPDLEFKTAATVDLPIQQIDTSSDQTNPRTESFDDFASFTDTTADNEDCGGWAAFSTTDQDLSGRVQDDNWVNIESEPVSTESQAFQEGFEDDDFGDFEDVDDAHLNQRLTDKPIISYKGLLETLFPDIKYKEDASDTAPISTHINMPIKKEQEVGPPKYDAYSKKRVIKRITVELNVWINLADVDSTPALSYAWSNSECGQSQLHALSIDQRNILNIKKEKIPVFAAQIGGLLEPKRSADTSAAVMPNQLIDTSSDKAEDRNTSSTDSDIPPAEFDWGTSGLTNPLGALEKELLSEMDATPAQKPRALPPLESILANMRFTPTMVHAPSVASPNQRPAQSDSAHSDTDATLTEEARRVIDSLPDLAFMHTGVLMFPLRSRSPDQGVATETRTHDTETMNECCGSSFGGGVNVTAETCPG